jgi:urease accessory protein
MLTDARSGVSARLEVSFGAGRSGRQSRVHASPPLELRGPFAGRSLPRFFLRNVTAGVFDGDCYDITLRTEPGAYAWVEPTSATRIHAGCGSGARSSLHLEAGAASTLVVANGLTIPYAGSRFVQAVDAVVHPDAALAYFEVMAVGRTASGERLAFRSFTSELRIHGDDRREPRYEERFVLCPAQTQAELETALAGASAVGSLFLLGRADIHAPALDSWPDVYAGVTHLPGEAGLLVRALGDTEAVTRCLESILVTWLGQD